MILSLFLPSVVKSGQCIYRLTILCQIVIIFLGKLQNYCIVKLPSLNDISVLVSSVLSADQLRK